MDNYDYYGDLETLWDEENEYIDSLPCHYSVVYDGDVFEGDKKTMNVFETESYDEAMQMYRYVSQWDENAVLKDNIYGVSFHDGEWN